MGQLLGDQADVTSRSPLKVKRVDDASVVEDVSAETVTFQYDNSGALASATGQAAGTMIYAKLDYDGLLNSFKDKVGDMKDSSFEFVTGTVLTTALALDIEIEVDKWRRMTVTEKFAEMAKWMKTNGQYWVDHADGAVWGLAAANVADDTANYSYKSPISGGSGGDKVDLIKIGGTSVDLGQEAAASSFPVVSPNYDAATDSDKASEVSPLDSHYENSFVDVDTTNVGAGPTYYPASTGVSMDTLKSMSFSGKIIEGDAELNTLTVEVTNDEDTTSGDWQQIYFFDNLSNAWVNSYTCNGTTTQMAASLDNLDFRYVRFKFVGGASATNTLIIKARAVPL